MIYVHVPFCRSFCTYCDFYSEALCKGKDWSDVFDGYAASICREISRRRDEIALPTQVRTLYFGGGTPSVLPLSCLGRIVSSLKEIQGGGWEEFTVEVNPDDITAGYAEGLRRLGVNRISMGVQSLSDSILRWMNRRHDSKGAATAFRTLRAAGFDNIGTDVIFGISTLDDDCLESTLSEIVSWHPEHISAYQLSVEEGSALHRMVEDGRYLEASDEDCRRQYGLICSILRNAGYEHYEISNWALPGYRSKHNSAYWARVPYVGLGPGAHSFSIAGSEQRRSWNSESLQSWTPSSEVLGEAEIREEKIMLGLRCTEGFEGRHLSEDEWFISDTIISDIFLKTENQH